jgi:hypothetical protein
MDREVAVTEQIEVACPQEAALAVIQDIQTIETTEVKVDTVQVIPQTEQTGTYKARGSAAGIPWRNEFAYTLHPMGFHSVEAYPPPSGVRVKGGFAVVKTGAQSCLILHYEQYIVPRWAWALKPAISLYLRWTMKKELRDLQALILERQAKAASKH